MNRRRLKRGIILSAAALILFLFFGKYILTALQISQASLGAAGGIIVFLIALRLRQP